MQKKSMRTQPKRQARIWGLQLAKLSVGICEALLQMFIKGFQRFLAFNTSTTAGTTASSCLRSLGITVIPTVTGRCLNQLLG
jgi:hypothetical protein